ncbi:MAG: hypothetical protein NZ927_02220 [Candidatus Calescibacterium sp.]|nr:hypothetical protein [Candidatus Calescibacterium sp.]MDW8086877.1 hypothetical protein [Candidatus Calescibacterium sp.]
MKKIFISLFILISAAILSFNLPGCGGGEESNPCKELGEKINQCLNDACKGKSNCDLCKCVLDPKAPECTAGGTGGTPSGGGCEGEVKKQAEEGLKNFNCSNYTEAIKIACP